MCVCVCVCVCVWCVCVCVCDCVCCVCVDTIDGFHNSANIKYIPMGSNVKNKTNISCVLPMYPHVISDKSLNYQKVSKWLIRILVIHITFRKDKQGMDPSQKRYNMRTCTAYYTYPQYSFLLLFSLLQYLLNDSLNTKYAHTYVHHTQIELLTTVHTIHTYICT